MIVTIIWGVLIYVRVLGFAELQAAFSAWITSQTMSPIRILICILLAYAVLGMFMDAIGMNCFVGAGVRDDLSVQDVFKGVTPFFIADAVTIALLVAFPAIVLWLPGQV